MLIERLARNINRTLKGFGKIFLACAIKKALQNIVGIYAHEVESINKKVNEVYTSFGFLEQSNTFQFVPIKTITELI